MSNYLEIKFNIQNKHLKKSRWAYHTQSLEITVYALFLPLYFILNSTRQSDIELYDDLNTLEHFMETLQRYPDTAMPCYKMLSGDIVLTLSVVLDW